MQTEQKDWSEDVGQPAYSAISEMVAALQVDYERLEELREERDGFDGDGYDSDDWSEVFPDDSEELAELEENAGDCESEDDARERIQEDPLSLRVFGERTNGEWEATNYELLLTTGGPAVRIVGDLNDGEASSARLEVQDWFKPWTEHLSDVDNDVLMAYVSCFYFGE